MNTEHWTDRLSAYLDGELSVEDLEAAERHLEGWLECRVTLDQLRRVTQWASGYEGTAPRAALWPRIEAAVRARDAQPARGRLRARWWPATMPQAAAAAVTLLAVGMGGWWAARVTRDDASVSTVSVPAANNMAAVSPAIRSTRIAAERYGRAVDQLEQVLLQDEVPLDSVTVRVLREKLAIIDRAIDEAHDALEGDPNSEYLADHFAGMMRRKLELLRHTTRLAQS